MTTQRLEAETVARLADLVDGQLIGDGSACIEGVADVHQARARDIAFVKIPPPDDLARQIRAGALLVTEPCAAQCPQIVVANPHSAFAAIARGFHPDPRPAGTEVHPTAVVAESATLTGSVRIGPHAVVGENSVIGEGTILHAGSVIGDRVQIGEDCTIHPRATIYDGVRLGDRVILHAGAVLGSDGFGYVIESDGIRNKFPQLGGLVIGDDVEIGANSTLDRGALTDNRIGDGVKIDNLCHIGHNCTIGDNSTISALCAFAASTHIGSRVIIGGHVVVGGHAPITIADDVIVGGNSGVTSNIRDPGTYSGFPLQPHAESVRSLVLQGRLPQMLARVKRLEQKMKTLRSE